MSLATMHVPTRFTSLALITALTWGLSSGSGNITQGGECNEFLATDALLCNASLGLECVYPLGAPKGTAGECKLPTPFRARLATANQMMYLHGKDVAFVDEHKNTTSLSWLLQTIADLKDELAATRAELQDTKDELVGRLGRALPACTHVVAGRVHDNQRYPTPPSGPPSRGPTASSGVLSPGLCPGRNGILPTGSKGTLTRAQPRWSCPRPRPASMRRSSASTPRYARTVMLGHSVSVSGAQFALQGQPANHRSRSY